MIITHNVRAALSGAVLLVFVAAGCASPGGEAEWPQAVSVPSAEVAVEGMEAPVRLGGYGSALAFSAQDSTFWLLTDRGPNVDGAEADTKVFPLPDYVPQVGVFRYEGDSLRSVRRILLFDKQGRRFCGLPNETGEGQTGESALGLGGNVLHAGQRRGIDPEGLALMPDGTFWVSDEYGPFLMHFSAEGRCMQVRSPFNGGLPAVYARRRPNRGMEGLCANRAGTLLYGILQSPLLDAAGYASPDELPLCVVPLPGGDVREYLYPLDAGAEGVSALACVDDSTLLALERDGAFPDEGRGLKRIYRVRLPQAVPGRPVRVRKELELDLLQAVPGYAHDKAEGLALVGDSILVVANDDDFGLAAGDDDAPCRPKLNPSGQVDFNELVFVRHRVLP